MPLGLNIDNVRSPSGPDRMWSGDAAIVPQAGALSADRWSSLDAGAIYQQYSPAILGGTVPFLLALAVLLVFVLRLNRRLKTALSNAARLEQSLRQTAETLESHVAERTGDLVLRTDVLDRINRGLPLKEILEYLCRQIEGRHPESQCCIVLQEAPERYVSFGTSRPPPECYLRLAQTVDTNGSSCPVRNRLTIQDVLHLPWWRPHRTLTRRSGLRSLWIEPILEHRNEVVGSLLLLHRLPRKAPRGVELTRLEDYARLTALAVEHHRTDQELRIAATAFESQDGIFVTDANRIVVRVNHAACEITGYCQSELLGRSAQQIRSDRHGDDFYESVELSLASHGFWRGEVWTRRKNGEVFPQWQTITAVSGRDGQASHYVTSFSDITAYKSAEEQIRQLAYYDPLTRLPNRRLMIDRLEQALLASSRNRRHGALMFLDLDNFKILNDTHSHEVGDLLLIEVGRRLQQCVRAKDTIARLGGDEFLVMMEDLDEARPHAAVQAEAVAEKIRTALTQPYRLEAHPSNGATQRIEHQCTSSIGISLFQEHEGNSSVHLKRADLAMYQAKAAGRNAIRFFDPDMQESLAKRSVLAEELKQGFAADQLHLLYQLQVDEEGHPVGAEALIRWAHPQRGLIVPHEFLPLAEETGLVSELSHWVLASACRRLASWAKLPNARSLHLAVNVSRRQFRQSDFVASVRRLLAESGAKPNRLTLEITEKLILEDVDDAITKMALLKAIGVRFAMDDFGTGYSSLSYLQRLPIDQIKIDRSCIQQLPDNLGNASLVKTVIGLCGNMGITVIAEGVETDAQHRFLRDKGCGYFQGYLFARPLQETELIERLGTRLVFDSSNESIDIDRCSS